MHRWLLPLAAAPLWAQTAAWQEFSLGPAVRKPLHSSDVPHGALHASSISLRALIAVAAGLPEQRIVGPEWIATEHYSIAAVLDASSQSRLRRRSEGESSIDSQFRSLLGQELAARFHLEQHREVQDRLAYTLRAAAAAGRSRNLRPSSESERARIEESGTPLTNATRRMDAHGATLEALCNRLQRVLQAPVGPDPSLPPGVWDFRLHWKTGDTASLAAALRDQLGLELIAEPRRQEYLVVDRIERP